MPNVAGSAAECLPKALDRASGETTTFHVKESQVVSPAYMLAGVLVAVAVAIMF